ncbi:MAG: alanine racemase [Rikenellaceae bacterium]
MNYKLSEIAKICGGRLLGKDHIVENIVTDSRSFRGAQGGLFAAMRGANHDSHLFINEMSGRGIESFLVEDDTFVDISKGAFVVVESSIKALQSLATHHRKGFSGRVIAITGSNGKTTIKEWVAQLMPTHLKVFRSPRSYNSQLGVALSLLMISGDEDLAIIEAGISQPNEMERLARMIAPEVVIISSIGDAHQEGFDSLEQKIAEKFILAKGAQKMIYHSGYPQLAEATKSLGGEVVDAAKFEGITESRDLATLRNSQIVEALFETLGYTKPTLTTTPSLAMRLELREGINDSIIINDSYNSDLNSLTIAVDHLCAVASGRAKTLILSDILQSSLPREELYGRVAEIIDSAKIDKLIGVGGEISASRDIFNCDREFFATTEELLNSINREDFAGRSLLLKGNRESRFERIGNALSRKSHTTTLEVDLDAMIHNLNYFRSQLAPTTKLTAMVKASSYGAGDYEIAQQLQYQGVDYLAVAFADEGTTLRDRGITMPIIVLNADDGSFSQMIDSRLEPEIYSLKSLRSFTSAVTKHGEREYPIHLKLDTGMHRLGFMEHEVDGLLDELKSLSGEVRVASIFSHLCTSDMHDRDETTHRQLELFSNMNDKIKESLNYPIICHIANSAAIARFSEAQADMCRLGIGLYGFGEGENLIPISTLKSKIVQIKEHPKGSTIGYAEAGVLGRDSMVATIPIGYADGLDRHLGCGAWSMLIGNKAAPIVGRICMDSCMVDITDIGGVMEGDEVVIFSSQRGNTAEDMAHILQTIPYEILTSVSSRVKRIYLKE